MQKEVHEIHFDKKIKSVTQGQYVDKFSRIITDDCDCYVGNKILFKFRKSVLPKELTDNAYNTFIHHAKKINKQRGKAAGLHADGRAVNSSSSRETRSNIVGFFDKPTIQDKVKLKNLYGYVPSVYCRQTAFTRDNLNKFNSNIPFFERIDRMYKALAPEDYERQRRQCMNVKPNFIIGSTTFSTVTCNYNWRRVTKKYNDRDD